MEKDYLIKLLELLSRTREDFKCIPESDEQEKILSLISDMENIITSKRNEISPLSADRSDRSD